MSKHEFIPKKENGGVSSTCACGWAGNTHYSISPLYEISMASDEWNEHIERS